MCKLIKNNILCDVNNCYINLHYDFFCCIKFEVHYLCISSDSLILSMRKLPTKATKTYLPEALKLFDVWKESNDLFTSDVTATEGDSEENSKEISN